MNKEPNKEPAKRRYKPRPNEKYTSSKDYKTFEDLSKLQLVPTLPPIILYRMAVEYRWQYNAAVRSRKKAHKEKRQIVKGVLDVKVPKIEKERIAKVKFNRNDITDLLLICHLTFTALDAMRMNPRDNAFLTLAVLSLASKRPTVSTASINSIIGSYRQSGGISVMLGKLMSAMVRSGYLSCDNPKNTLKNYFITTKGKAYLRTGTDAMNLVLTRGYREHDKLINK